MDSKEARAQLICEHGEICFLGGEISKKNRLTVHHIIPVRMGGRMILENLAPLCRLEHDMFNVVENHYPIRAAEVNDYFYYFSETHDLEALKQMRAYVVYATQYLGYHVEDRGRMLVLKR